MTQETLLALCRLEIPEINSTDVISDANLLIILNLACTEFIDKTDALPSNSTFNLVQDLVEYPLSTYVTDYGKPRKEGLWLYNASTEKWRRLDPTSMMFLSQHFPNWLNHSSGLPQRYSLDGDILTLDPKASSTYAGTDYLKLFYYKRSVDMSGGTHYPFSGSTTRYPHLADYEQDLVHYVRYKIKKMLKKDASAEEAKTMFYRKCGDAKLKLASRPDLISEVKSHGAGNMLHHKGAYST